MSILSSVFARDPGKTLLLSVALSFIILNLNSYCQESGYIITKDNEFRGGSIKRTNSRSTSVNFAEIGSDKFRLYSPEELLEYGFHRGKIYTSRIVTIVRKDEVITLPLFLERTVTGNINLYVVNHESRKYFFLETDGNHLIPLNSNPESSKEAHREALNHYLSDCEAINPYIESSCLSKRYLTTLVERYNACDNRIVPRFQVGVYTGLELTTITFPKGKTNISSLSEADFGLTAVSMFGIYSNIPIEGGISMHAEMGYSTGSFSSQIKEKTGGGLIIEDVQIKFSMVDFLVSIKYSSLHPRAQTYVHGGAGLAYAITRDNELERYYKTDSTEIIETFDWTREAMSKAYLKILFGVGVNFNLSNRYTMFIEARIEEILANDPPTPNLTGISLVTGVSF